MSEQAASHGSAKSGGGAFDVHIVPWQMLVAVFLALIGLTVLTVGITYFDLGAANLWFALVIAGIKATLVALIFMHLKYDWVFHGFLFLGGVLFVFLFIGFALMDTTAYQPEIISGYAPEID